METVYQIMKYEYDGCGSSWDEPTYDNLRRTKEGAEKVIREYGEEADWTVSEDKYYGLIAVKLSGMYAYVRYYITELELED